MSLPLRRTGLNTETSFAFSCDRCSKCCRCKKIQVNPYEIARLADNLAISTGEFVRRFTTSGGTQLACNDDETCVFLSPGGCGVHRDRPLVCRLYPLGRHVSASGEESYSEIEPEPGCTGVYGEERAIGDYLDSQGARPYMQAADKYLRLFCKLYEIMRDNVEAPVKRKAEKRVTAGVDASAHDQVNDMMDIDTVVSNYCRENDLPFPKDPDEKMALHIQAVEAWANNYRR
ncbi:MAG: YkgJ family cysteine cluster protein [Geobacteraceae bacterium]|nr:YkgJ family cysteine cluster protein [Geobacteraceae bacterium]